MDSIKNRRRYKVITAGILVIMLSMCVLLTGCGGSADSGSGDSSSEDSGSTSSYNIAEEGTDVQAEKAAFAEYFKALTDDAAVRAQEQEANGNGSEWSARVQGHDVNGDGVADMFVYSLPSTTDRQFYAAAYSGGQVVETPIKPTIMAIDIPLSIYWLKDGSGFIVEESTDTETGENISFYYQLSEYKLPSESDGTSGFALEAIAQSEIMHMDEEDDHLWQEWSKLRENTLAGAEVIPGEECSMTVGQVKLAANHDEFAELLSGYGITLE